MSTVANFVMEYHIRREKETEFIIKNPGLGYTMDSTPSVVPSNSDMVNRWNYLAANVFIALRKLMMDEYFKNNEFVVPEFVVKIAKLCKFNKKDCIDRSKKIAMLFYENIDLDNNEDTFVEQYLKVMKFINIYYGEFDVNHDV